ncbi:hypothetical protein OIV83_003610 [Microbotryomycetes sp. JL201]|nr:hypothetical protein OIV83_003610 [Microbotryomycetes sp. JL201]
MPPPSTIFTGRAASGLDPATLSDDDDLDSDTTSLAATTSTTATLGYADGLLDSFSDDANDWKTSRIGGQPCFPPLSFVPPQESARCQVCSTLMPLLAQIYCPLETSTLERVLYVFACVRKPCQGRTGSIRAWRVSQMWSQAAKTATSPTSTGGAAGATSANVAAAARPLDLGSLVFGGGSTASKASGSDSSAVGPDSVNVINPFAPLHTKSASTPFNPFALPSSSSSSSLLTASSSVNPFAMTWTDPRPTSPPGSNSDKSSSTGLTTSSRTKKTKYLNWSESNTLSSETVFKAQYVATMYEPDEDKGGYEKLDRKIAELEMADQDDDDGYGNSRCEKTRKEGKGSGGRVKKGADRASGGKSSPYGGGAGGGNEWSQEGYEVQKIKGVDQVFLRFQARCLREPSQVLRYNHGGSPLAFSSALEPFKTLFKPTSLTMSTSGTTDDSFVGHFASSLIPKCPACSSERVFELQLMPNLIYELGQPLQTKATSVDADDEDEKNRKGLGWSSVWVCTCSIECTQQTDLEQMQGEAWREERVYIEVEQ